MDGILKTNSCLGNQPVISRRRLRERPLVPSAFNFLNRQLGSLKPNLAMSSVTKWLGNRTAAATQGKSGFAGQVILVAIGVHQLDGSFRSFHAIRTIRPYRNFYCSHEASVGTCGCEYGEKISASNCRVLAGRGGSG